MTLIKSISGIRGTIGGKVSETLSPVDIVKFTSAFGSWIVSENTEKEEKLKVIIGRDARPTGEVITALVSATLQSLGIDVIDLSLATTPTVEIAVVEEEAQGGIILTASHNPNQWNALKLLNGKGEFISKEEGEKIVQMAEDDDFDFTPHNKLGIYVQNDEYLQIHIDKILDLTLVDTEAIKNANFKIVVDAVNSVGGIAIPALLKSLGVTEVKELFCEITGNFPHNPEPLPENLSEIASVMEKGNFNIGIVVDPDVDRLALVTEDGTIFGEEYTLVTVADYILQNKKGATVSNLSSTRALKDITEKAGEEYFASAVGEVNVVKKMKEVNAVIGGEGNGGVIYPELHYGRDALVGVALILSFLAKSKQTLGMLKAKYPKYHLIKNKIALSETTTPEDILGAMQEKYKKQPINTEDGLKIEFDTSWVHLRRSNTEPIIRIYTEAEFEATANNLKNKIMEDIKEIMSEKN